MLYFPKQNIALLTVTLVFLTCIIIAFSNDFSRHAFLSTAVFLDLLITAPIAYLLLIYRTDVSKFTTLKVAFAGLLLATLILPSNVPLIYFLKNWFGPLLEGILVGFTTYQFYIARKQISMQPHSSDFLMYCREVFRKVLGNNHLSLVIAAEVSVFYYLLKRHKINPKEAVTFSTYKKNGSILILTTFLCLFIIETISLHFLLSLANTTIAWILTGLSIYSCLQLIAHIRSIKARPILLENEQLLLRNGILGGDVLLNINDIMRLEKNKNLRVKAKTIKLALISGLESHNTAIYLKESVWINKAMGVRKQADIILIHIDEQEEFIAAVTNKLNTQPH